MRSLPVCSVSWHTSGMGHTGCAHVRNGRMWTLKALIHQCCSGGMGRLRRTKTLWELKLWNLASHWGSGLLQRASHWGGHAFGAQAEIATHENVLCMKSHTSWNPTVIITIAVTASMDAEKWSWTVHCFLEMSNWHFKKKAKVKMMIKHIKLMTKGKREC